MFPKRYPKVSKGNDSAEPVEEAEILQVLKADSIGSAGTLLTHICSWSFLPFQ